MGYWFIIHDLESYEEHPNLIGMLHPDRNFRSIRRDDKIVYYAVGKKLVGIFSVAQKGRILGKDRYWKPDDFVYDIVPVLRPPVPIDFEAKEFGVTMLRRTTTPLSKDQYEKILLWLLRFEKFPEEMNHDMLVALFVKMHSDLGYPTIKLIRPQFPDCITLDENNNEAKIEFEVRAMDFQRDPSHDLDKCDKIICWEDDWGGTAPEGKILSLKEWLFG